MSNESLESTVKRYVQDAIEQAITKVREELIEQAIVNFEQEIRRVVGNAAIKLANVYSVQMLSKEELVIHVKIEPQQKG